jgi:L-ascorbate metabolism protein UlaG (beta-lactamase superfamily)
LGHVLTDDLINEIGSVDVLMIPVGGVFTIGPKEAVEIAGKIDPYFILPMHYKVPEMKGDKFSGLEPVETFIKETGMTVENLPKLTVKRDDIIEDQSTKVVILERK